MIFYLFGIFIVAIGLFLFIPQFFDYKNKEQMIKLFLSDNLDLKVYEMYNIKKKKD